MPKVINHVKLTETLALSECADGYWLYDKTRGMNLAMRAKSEQTAFVEALGYYQKRLTQMESAYACLDGRVRAFTAQFVEEDD